MTQQVQSHVAQHYLAELEVLLVAVVVLEKESEKTDLQLVAEIMVQQGAHSTLAKIAMQNQSLTDFHSLVFLTPRENLSSFENPL
jgi:hypothetical protein